MNIYGQCSLVSRERERAKEMNDWYFLVQVGMRGNFEASNHQQYMGLSEHQT